MNTSTPTTTSSKRSCSVLSTPDTVSDQKKNRIQSDSFAEEYQYTIDTMSLDAPIDQELVETISSAVKKSVTANMEPILKGMIDSIVDGVVSSLKNRITLVEESNEILRKENKILIDRVSELEKARIEAEQYSRRNSLRISGIPESALEAGESTDEIVLNLCKDLGANVNINEIDRSHRSGKPGGAKPRPILVKFISYRARQKLYQVRRELKEFKGREGVFVNEDLTKERSHVLFNARSLVRSSKLEGAWSQDGTVLVKIAAQNHVGFKILRVYNQSDLDNLVKVD